MAKIDLIGKKINRLTVIKYSHNNKHSHKMWECLCDCGNKIIASTNSLNRENTKSCGCLQKEKALTTKV